MDSEQPILSEVCDSVGTIMLNRPRYMNAFTPKMIERLAEVAGDYERRADVRAVLIRGAGDHFMAGGNLKRFRDMLSGDEREDYIAGAEDRVVAAHLIVQRLRRMAKPVIVAVHGAVAGFGTALLLAADLAIAADDAYFAFAYTKIGLPGDGGITYSLPWLVGERRALELILLGDRFDATRAAELGVVNRVVPRASLEEESMALALRLAKAPTAALGAAKRLIRGAGERGWEQQLVAEASAAAAAVATRDHLEGVSAFLEKRDPLFEGR